jgi:hypothetical protein
LGDGGVLWVFGCLGFGVLDGILDGIGGGASCIALWFPSRMVGGNGKVSRGLLSQDFMAGMMHVCTEI